MAEPFIGEIRMVGFQYAPVGWANADGQLVSVNENPTLYSLYGTLYGGDGRTTFGLPNFRGHVPIHVGHGTGLPDYHMGQAGGHPTVVLSTPQIPAHSHEAAVHAASSGADQPPQDHYWGNSGRGQYNTGHDATLNTGAVEVQEAGGGNAHENMPPYLTIRFCVALVGIYPQRP